MSVDLSGLTIREAAARLGYRLTVTPNPVYQPPYPHPAVWCPVCWWWDDSRWCDNCGGSGIIGTPEPRIPRYFVTAEPIDHANLRNK